MKSAFSYSTAWAFIVLIISFLVSSKNIQAHPVSYQGATSVMTWNQPFLNDFMTTYSFRNNMAVAGRFMRMTMEDGNEMKLYLPQFNYLLKRWNATESQANIYLFGGFGAQNFQNQTGYVGLTGIEADAESRRLYVSGKFQAILPKFGPNIYQSQLRAGIAAYPSEFEEIGTWFIASLQYDPQLIRKVILTPMARFYYKNVLWEAGSSFKGDWMLNFMFHF